MFEKKNLNNMGEQLNNIEEQLAEIELLRQSVDEHKKSLKSFWKSFLVTGFIMVAAMIALLFGAMAWFVANNRTNAGSAEISANGGYTFSLATLKDDSQGVYDVNSSESTDSPLAKALSKFYRVDRNGRDDKGDPFKTFLDLPNLNVGTSLFKDEDGNVYTDDNGKQYILGDSDGISLMVSETSNVNNTKEFEHIGPGSYGQFTFYVIPHVDGFNKVTLSVSIKAFTLVREGQEGAAENKNGITGRAEPVLNTENNTVLLNMLQGHILIFTGKDADGNYTGRIEPTLQADGRISFVFEKDATTTTWVKNQPEPVTIYWIWPKRFENIKYCGQDGSVFKNVCAAHTALLTWINSNRQLIVNTKIVTDYASLENPTVDMSNKGFAKWNMGYNKGDQLIGDNVAFFQWIIDAQ